MHRAYHTVLSDMSFDEVDDSPIVFKNKIHIRQDLHTECIIYPS